MDPQNCPHCGASLPPTSDAYCSECRNELPTPTGAAAPARTGPTATVVKVVKGASWFAFGALLGLGLLVAGVGALFNIAFGDDWLYGMLIFVVGGAPLVVAVVLASGFFVAWLATRDAHRDSQ